MTLTTLLNANIEEALKVIAQKVYRQERITEEEGVYLFEKADFSIPPIGIFG